MSNYGFVNGKTYYAEDLQRILANTFANGFSSNSDMIITQYGPSTYKVSPGFVLKDGMFADLTDPVVVTLQGPFSPGMTRYDLLYIDHTVGGDFVKVASGDSDPSYLNATVPTPVSENYTALGHVLVSDNDNDPNNITNYPRPLFTLKTPYVQKDYAGVLDNQALSIITSLPAFSTTEANSYWNAFLRLIDQATTMIRYGVMNGNFQFAIPTFVKDALRNEIGGTSMFWHYDDAMAALGWFSGLMEYEDGTYVYNKFFSDAELLTPTFADFYDTSVTNGKMRFQLTKGIDNVISDKAIYLHQTIHGSKIQNEIGSTLIFRVKSNKPGTYYVTISDFSVPNNDEVLVLSYDINQADVEEVKILNIPQKPVSKDHRPVWDIRFIYSSGVNNTVTTGSWIQTNDHRPPASGVVDSGDYVELSEIDLYSLSIPPTTNIALLPDHGLYANAEELFGRFISSYMVPMLNHATGAPISFYLVPPRPLDLVYDSIGFKWYSKERYLNHYYCSDYDTFLDGSPTRNGLTLQSTNSHVGVYARNISNFVSPQSEIYDTEYVVAFCPTDIMYRYPSWGTMYQ